MSDAASPPPFTPPSSPTLSKKFHVSPIPPIGARRASNSPSPFLIGVAGGTASGKSLQLLVIINKLCAAGKTSVCKKIMEHLGQEDCSQKRVVMLSQDAFYKKLDATQKKLANRGEYNFDHPGC